MKKFFTFAAIFAFFSVIGTAIAVQSPLGSYIATNVSGYLAPLNLTTTSELVTSAGGTSSVLAASGVPFVVKATAGRIVEVNVISASGVGAIYDVATAASAVAANQIAAIPATVGTYRLDFPASTGIVINPSSSVMSISYR